MAKSRKLVENFTLRDARSVEEVQVQLSIDDDGFEPTYSNYVEIARSQFDFELRFARVPAKFSADQISAARNGETVSIQAATKIILSFDVFDKLADLLVSQRQIWRDTQNVTD